MIVKLRPAKRFFAPLLAAVLCSSASLPEVDKDKAIGGPAAPIRVEIFSSFDCQPCKQLHEQFLPLLVRDYVISGKVYVVHRESPLEGHPLARRAADYATAAAHIGKYWQVADALFKHQLEWQASGRVWETVAPVLTPAEQSRVRALGDDPAVDAEVQRDMARRLTYIPTIIVTSKSRVYPINGLPDFGFFRQLMNMLLG